MADLKRRIVAEFSAKNKAKGEMAGFRKDLDTTGRSMKRMAGQALAMAGLGGGLYAMKRGLAAVTKAAMTQERAERDLIAATQGSIGQFKDYAARMQELTVYGDEQILSQMAYARNLGVTKDRLKEAATAAIGLAARYRIDLSAAMMLVGRASSGQTQMLTRYGIVIDQTMSAQDKFNEILKIGAKSFRLAEEEALSAEGAFSKLGNTYSDMLEIIGEPMVQALAQNAKATKGWLEDIRPGFKRYISDVAEGLEMMRQLDLKMWDLYKDYSPLGLIYQGIKPPPPEPISKPALGPLSESEISEIMQLLKSYEAQRAKLLRLQAEQDEMMRQHRVNMLEKGGTLSDMEWRRDAERISLKIKAESDAAQQIEDVRTEMWLKEEAAAYHAMRAPIIEAENLARDSAERRKRIAEDIAMTMANSWTDAMDRMAFEGRKFWDAMQDMARGLLREIMNIIMYKEFAEPLAFGLMGRKVPGGDGQGGGGIAQALLMGALGAAGGMFGGGGMPTAGTVTPEAGATLARYQRGGIATNPHFAMVGEVPEAIVPLSGGRSIPVEMRSEKSGWAKVHTGETFSGAGKGGGSIKVEIHNEGVEKLEVSKVEEYIISDERIIAVTTRAMQTDMKYRRSIKQVSR